ncbi:MAG TPA: hypothetical protein VI172_14875 [Candidatus Dormibacteraeota bacterium]
MSQNLLFAYVKQLLKEQKRPLTVEEMAAALRVPVDTMRNAVQLWAGEHGRLRPVDGGYLLVEGS